ncbi:F18O14.12 [Arabidopsis thaliana]|uniref:F18O14.12 n=1 Tax=Arabidopsis thaliana TaxID=3702 RepID=Q9LN58_ARATH|nr:F18O14.12 [Arabidopsis thaliana]
MILNIDATIQNWNAKTLIHACITHHRAMNSYKISYIIIKLKQMISMILFFIESLKTCFYRSIL